MKRHCYLFALLTLMACAKKNDSAEEKKVSDRKISETRSTVNPKPVATFSEKVKDKDGLNDWKFAVDLYETEQTFKYVIKVKYKELDAADTLWVPEFGIEPKVEVQKGPGEHSCIIGFLGKSNEFKEYKRVEVIGDELKIRQTKRYAKIKV